MQQITREGNLENSWPQKIDAFEIPDVLLAQECSSTYFASELKMLKEEQFRNPCVNCNSILFSAKKLSVFTGQT